jgi:uncharacterized protein YjiS (DUF1127 family)
MSNVHEQVLDRTAGSVTPTMRTFMSGAMDSVAKVFYLLLTWQERASERANLAALDDHMLKDMGLSRADVEHESSKPFWRP